MAARPLLTIAVLALLAAPLAGCLDRGDSDDVLAQTTDGSTPSTITALDGLVTAAVAAGEWRADAVLAGVSGTEGAPVLKEDPPFVFDTGADGVVGDGRAIAWTYAFRAPDAQETFFAAVHAEDGLVYARALAHAHYPSHAGAGNTTIDTTDAAIAVAANATVQAFLEDHPESLVRWTLWDHGEGPQWVMMRRTTSGYGVGALVDAMTGEVLEVERWPQWRLPEPCPEDADCTPCPASDCAPQAPEAPEDERHERTFSFDAFNRHAEMHVEPYEWWPFGVNATITATIPDGLPGEEWTLTVRGFDWTVRGKDAGAGTLTVALPSDETFAWDMPLFVTVEAPAHAVTPRSVDVVAEIEYDASSRVWPVWYEGEYGHVGYRQTTEHGLPVRDDITTLLVRAAVEEYTTFPPSGSATFELLDPEGAVVASSEDAGAFRVDDPVRGTYRLRVTAGDDALFGTMYGYTAMGVVDEA